MHVTNWCSAVVLVSGLVVPAGAGDQLVPFDSDRWEILAGELVEHDGRRCLAGTAVLGDVALLNGVIEVDLWADGSPSYPGIQFRRQAQGEAEEVYVRPHRSPNYPDAVQYTPVFGGVSAWQLYSGGGYSAGADIPRGQWLHLKVEVQGGQARVFLGDGASPVLEVPHLVRTIAPGGIALSGARRPAALFSNFSYRTDDGLLFEPPPPQDTPPGVITDWELSLVLPAGSLSRDRLPSDDELAGLAWRPVGPEPSGLVNISRVVRRSGAAPESVLARTTLHAAAPRVMRLLLGYSDRISVFLDGRILFDGESAYRSRDPSFVGVVGPFDAVYLPLVEGDNELVLAVTESTGGWGFRCQDGEAVLHHPRVESRWQTAATLAMPESVVYDRARRVVYVSNYDGYNPSFGEGRQSLTRITLDGEVTDREWVTGLRNPTGMAMVGDRLWVVERVGLVEIDPDTADVVARYAAPRPGFLNDLAADPGGALYVSDSRRNAILRFAGGRFEEWVSGDEIGAPNGLHVAGGDLLVGTNADGRLKAVDLATGEVRTVVRLGQGTIDGIRSDSDGGVLVSHWEGRLFRIAPSGAVVKLLDTTVRDWPVADFEVVPDRGLIVIPTFLDNRVMAYRLAPQ